MRADVADVDRSVSARLTVIKMNAGRRVSALIDLQVLLHVYLAGTVDGVGHRERADGDEGEDVGCRLALGRRIVSEQRNRTIWVDPPGTSRCRR